MEKNFAILMLFTLLAFGSLFYVLSLYSGEDLTGMLSAISGDYKRREGSRFLTTADEGGKLAPPTRTGNCPMSTREGRLTVNAPSDATVRILYAETGAELECRTGGFTKNICRSTFKIKSYKPGFKVFEKTVFLGAGQIATVDVDLKPGSSNELPCEGAATAVQETPTESTPATEQPTTTPVTETTVQESTSATNTTTTESQPQETPTPQTTDYPPPTTDQTPTPEEIPVEDAQITPSWTEEKAY